MAEHFWQALVEPAREGPGLAGRSPFDPITLNVRLPKTDGFAVAKRVRCNANQTPILMLTARDSSGDMVAGPDESADDYLTKPFPLHELFVRIRAVAWQDPVARPVCQHIGGRLVD